MDMKTVTKEEFALHLEEMRRRTGQDGKAPRSSQPKVNVREIVERLG